MTIVQRWQPDLNRDDEASQRDDFPALVARRPTVQVMHFADYDHDGQASEFYLQTGTEPCGKSVGMVIGLSKANPRLHVLGTTSTPTDPLYLQKEEWEAVRDASGPIEITDWTCGDHGAETETTLQLRSTPAGVEGKRREFTCPPDLRILIQEDPL